MNHPSWFFSVITVNFKVDRGFVHGETLSFYQLFCHPADGIIMISEVIYTS